MSNTVTLRALEPEDLDLICQIENDARLWPASASSQPLSRYVVRQYLEQQQADIYKDGQLRLVIESNGQAAGIADLTDFSPHHLRAEVGIVVLNQFHRQGIASETLNRLARYAARHLHLRSLYAYVAVSNAPALALFRACGYRLAGTLENWIEGEGQATIFQLLLPDGESA